MPRVDSRHAPRVVRIPGARPAHRPPHGLARVLVADRILRTLVERHENVAAKGELDVHGGFRREGVRIAIEVRSEHHALFGDLSDPRQAEHLESTGIGEDGARPGHEAVQAAQPPDQLVAGTKIEVVGVAE